MRRIVLISILVGFGAAILAAGFYWQFGRGLWAPFGAPPHDIAEVKEAAERTPENTTGFPLKLPPGFSISIFAKNLPGARVMVFDGDGNMWVSRTSQGIVTHLQLKDGKVVGQTDVFRNLKNPHGLAFLYDLPSLLYIAEENKISSVAPHPYIGEEDRTSDIVLHPELISLKKIADLPSGDGHFTRTLSFGPDGRLYVSIGSSCNVCHETDEMRAKIFSMNWDGSDIKEFARGLRNAVFFTWRPAEREPLKVQEKMWATEMGRDNLGDNLPPDEINVIAVRDPSPDGSGQTPLVPDFGWPICYGKNIHDTNFDPIREKSSNGASKNTCSGYESSYIDIPAHSAPLGIAFIPRIPESRGGWPEEYQGDLLVAYHGSWNRSEPTGYKVVRMKLDDNGRYLGTEDFITGWLTPNGALGRPVDLKFDDDGALYVSDDKAGVIYRVEYR